MKNKTIVLTIIFFVLFSVSAYADKFGNYQYFIPKESNFKLIPEDNGLYLQFSGQIDFEAELAIEDLGNNKKRVFVIVNDSLMNKFPYRKLGTIQLPTLVELVKSDNLAKSLMPKLSQDINAKGYAVIGKAKIILNGFNSSADCGNVSYFVFKYKVTDFIKSENMRYIKNKNC